MQMYLHKNLVMFNFRQVRLNGGLSVNLFIIRGVTAQYSNVYLKFTLIKETKRHLKIRG